MLPILEGEDFNAEPVPSLGCVSVSRNGSPLRDCVSPVTEKSSSSRCASVTLQRASSPTIVDNEASSAPASSLPSANCSRPTTAAGWTSVKSLTWQRQGASPRNSAGALFLSAVVHSGTTTTLAAVQLPSHSSLPTAPGHLQDTGPTFSKKLHADGSLAPNARIPDPISAATSELLAAAAMRLSQQASPKPLTSFRPQQLQQLHQQQQPPQQQNRRGPEPFREPSPPSAAASAQQHLGPHLTCLGGAGGGSGVLWDTPGREQQTSSNAGFKAAAPPALNIGMLASGLLSPHNDVRRQLGARRMPSVVLESPSRRPLPSREVTISPVAPGTVGRSPSRLGDSAVSPQHPQPHPISGALALAPLPSPFTSSPHSLSCCYEGDSFGNNTEAGVGGGHGSHNQRQQFTPTTVSFARPAPVTLQPVHLRPRGGATTLGFSATMSAPLPSVSLTAPNTAPGGTTCASTAQHPRATLPSWGSNRPAHGSPPSVDSEVPDQGLGLWNQGTVSVRVATVIPTLSVERNDNPKTGLTHVLHTQHMRLNAGGNGGGGGIVGAHGGSAATTALGTSAGALANSSSVDLTGSLRNHPQLQQFLQQHRHPKYDKLSQQQSEQEQAHLTHHQEQPQSPESPGLIVRSMSLVVMPSMPRFTPLPQAQAAGPSLGSPKARSAVAAHRASAVSNGLQSRPSTSPPTSPSRSPPRSPCRSPPRSPGRQTQCGGPPSAAATVPATGTQLAAPDVAAAAGVDIAAGDIEPTVLAVQPIAAISSPQKQRGPQDQQQHEDTSPQHVCQHRGPNPDNPSDGAPAAARSSSSAAPPLSQADTAPPQGSSTDSGEARHSPGNPMAASLPLHPPPALGPTLHKPLLHSAAHAPILLASANPTGPAHLGSYILGGSRSGAGMCVSAADGREGLPGHPLGRRMASKENGGLMLLKMHSQNQQRLQQQLLQQQLQQQLQDLEAEAAETEAEALIGSQTFSLRRTAYNDWLEGMPLKGARRSAASIGGVVAGGVEGKAVVLKKQPPERSSALFFKQADRKPLLGGDVLHVL